MAKYTGDGLVDGDPGLDAGPTGRRLPRRIDKDTSCVVVQYPDILGRIDDMTALAAACQAAGALLIAVVTEPVALGLMKAPGEMGADIVVGEGQSIGNGLQFGGPYVGLFATRQICAPDAGTPLRRDGRRRWQARLRADALHARAAYPPREGDEQHLHQFGSLRPGLQHPSHPAGRGGAAPAGRAQSRQGSQLADSARRRARREVLNDSFFNEFTVKLPKPAAEVVEALAAKGVLGGVPVSA
jgi:glycine dehydrogenase subunit 1